MSGEIGSEQVQRSLGEVQAGGCMRERTPAGREYATLAAGAGWHLPGGISMAIETIWKRSGLAFEILSNTFPEADSPRSMRLDGIPKTLPLLQMSPS